MKKGIGSAIGGALKGLVVSHPLISVVVILVLVVGVAQAFTGGPGKLGSVLVKQFIDDKTAELEANKKKQDELEQLLVQKDEFYTKKEQDLLKKIQATQRQVAEKDKKINSLQSAIATEQTRRANIEHELALAKAAARTPEEIHNALKTVGHRRTAPAPAAGPSPR